jgi:hypothetical protein
MDGGTSHGGGLGFFGGNILYENRYGRSCTWDYIGAIMFKSEGIPDGGGCDLSSRGTMRGGATEGH